MGTNEFIECRFCCTFAVGNLMFDLILITLKCIELFKWKVERGVVGSIATLTIACILSIAVNGCTNDGIMRGWSNTMAWWHPNVVFTITVMVFCSICPQIANIDCLYPLTTLTPINIATGEMSRAITPFHLLTIFTFHWINNFFWYPSTYPRPVHGPSLQLPSTPPPPSPSAHPSPCPPPSLTPPSSPTQQPPPSSYPPPLKSHPPPSLPYCSPPCPRHEICQTFYTSRLLTKKFVYPKVRKSTFSTFHDKSA